MHSSDAGQSAPIPGLDELLELAANRFPDANVSLIRPLLAEPFVMVSRGLFAAVFLRPVGERIQIRAGLPHSGFLAALGPLASLIGQAPRKALFQQVAFWARSEQSWLLSDG
jgi:hypothetical protein